MNKKIFLVVLAAVIIIAVVLVSLLTKKEGQTPPSGVQSSQVVDEGESFGDSEPLSKDLFE